MIEKFNKRDQRDLLDFPSAVAQDDTPLRGEANIAKPRRRARKSWLVRSFLFLSVLIFVGVVTGAFILSRGPISNEQVRAGLESQISKLLGENYQAKIGNANVALGERGLISIKVEDVKLSDKKSTNLGVVKDISVKLKALPFLKGEVKAESISLENAAVSILPFLQERDETTNSNTDFWKTKIDLNAGLLAIGKALQNAEKSIADAGLDSVSFNDTAIIGFESLGIRSRSATATRLEIKRNANFQSGLQIGGLVETKQSNWIISGSWLTENRQPTLLLQISGLSFRDFLFSPEQIEPGKFDMDGGFNLNIKVPYLEDGTPQQALGQIALSSSSLIMGRNHSSNITKATINFRILPERNEFVLEQSPIHFQTAKAVLLGRVTFSSKPDVDHQFELQAKDVVSYALLPNNAAAEADFSTTGKLDREQRRVNFEEIVLKSKKGTINAAAILDFNQSNIPHFKAKLTSKRFAVSEFKQLWPLFIAPKVRTWSINGVHGGEIRSAVVEAEFPFQTILDRVPLSRKQIKVSMDVIGASVQTAGDLPRLLNAKRPLRANLKLGLSSSASTIAALVSRKPLNVKEIKGLEASNVSGSIQSDVSAGLAFLSNQQIKAESWNVDSVVKNGSSRAKVTGRSISSADVKVAISSKTSAAKVSGSAKIDGFKADVALVQPLNGSAAQNSVTMQLDEKGRKKLGIDTDGILTGPVAVSLGSQQGGGTSISVDLRNAKLSFPWVGWSKGKGVGASATFVMYSKNGITELKNIKLRGSNFSAEGSLTVDKSGFRSARLKKIKLNKTDDFDVNVARTRLGYDVDLNARSYDGRAIIRSSLENKATSTGNKLRVNVKGSVRRLYGFNGQVLSGVSIEYVQQGDAVSKARIDAVAAGDAPTRFSMAPHQTSSY